MIEEAVWYLLDKCRNLYSDINEDGYVQPVVLEKVKAVPENHSNNTNYSNNTTYVNLKEIFNN